MIISETIAENQTNDKGKDLILSGKIVTKEELDAYKQLLKQNVKGSRQFFEMLKGELKDVPVAVKINIKSKQKDMVGDSNKLSNLITTFLKGGMPISVLAKPMNELL